ncbi:hypothetical protein ACFCWY_08870 [Streptomyces sp. NPDC056362]|uniref:hypothetical protein n=1 Tax=unclassified Streptomyces TaxID=2593676 RepID=UPI0035DE0B72
MSSVDEITARSWYVFVRERLEEELRAAYPLHDEQPMNDYRERYREAQQEHLELVDALARRDDAAATEHLWGLRNQASRWKAHPDFPAPVSDGTLPCPVPAPETGHPCTKSIPKGWASYEGHGGGHWWQAPKVAELEARGVHYDPGTLLSGQATPWHEPKDCTPACWKWSDR